MSMLVFCVGYPLFVLAIWIGATQGRWEAAALFVALGVTMGFLGWGLLTYACAADESAEGNIADARAPARSSFAAFYNRAGVVAILLSSYTVLATNRGWPLPAGFVGWFALVTSLLALVVAVPVSRSRSFRDID